jgi:hypothetical protein
VTTETFPALRVVGERHGTYDRPVAVALLDNRVSHYGIFVHIVEQERHDDPPEEERRALHEFLARTDAGGVEPDRLADAVLLHPGDQVRGDVGAEGGLLVRASTEGAQHRVLSGEDILQVRCTRRFARHDGEPRVLPIQGGRVSYQGLHVVIRVQKSHRVRVARRHHSPPEAVFSYLGVDGLLIEGIDFWCLRDSPYE